MRSNSATSGSTTTWSRTGGTPIGGFRGSGYGKEGGMAGVDEITKAQASLGPAGLRAHGPAMRTDARLTSDRADASRARGRGSGIYQIGIDEGNATFETAAPTWQQFDAGKLPEHRHVALDEEGRRVLGWAAVVRCLGAPGLRRRRRALRLRPPRSPRTRRRHRTSQGAHHLDRSRRYLDHPVRHLPREHRQSRPAYPLRLPCDRHSSAGRAPSRTLARRRDDRTAQPHHHLITRTHGRPVKAYWAKDVPTIVGEM